MNPNKRHDYIVTVTMETIMPCCLLFCNPLEGPGIEWTGVLPMLSLLTHSQPYTRLYDLTTNIVMFFSGDQSAQQLCLVPGKSLLFHHKFFLTGNPVYSSLEMGQ